MNNLTADLVARAIVAAAMANGDDPVKACTCHPKDNHRRALTATASALNLELGVDLRDVERVLGVNRHTVYNSRNRNPAPFQRAEAAAREAIRPAQPHARRPLRLVPLVSAAPARPAPAAVPVAPKPARPVVRAPETPGTLRARILDVLKDGGSTSPSLAILTDAKELAVLDTLKVLVADGLVEGGPIPPQGARAREWRIVQELAA